MSQLRTTLVALAVAVVGIVGSLYLLAPERGTGQAPVVDIFTPSLLRSPR